MQSPKRPKERQTFGGPFSVINMHCRKSWSAQAWKRLEMYTRAQASAQACIHVLYLGLPYRIQFTNV